MKANVATLDGLLAIILKIIRSNGGLDEAQIVTKLLCFGAEGIVVFQRCKIGISKQILEKFALFMIAVHFCTHQL